MRVAVIGAGIAGITIAAELSNNGFGVDIFDKNGVAEECSYANGGQLSVCNAEVWNTWSNVWKGAKWMFKSDAPLFLNPVPTPDKILWLTDFLRHTVMNTYEKNTVETIRLGLISRQVYQEYLGKSKREIGLSDCGMLHVYTNKDSLETALRAKGMFESNGVEWDYIAPNAIKKVDMGMSKFQNMAGGIFTRSDSVVDIHKLCHYLLERTGTTLQKKEIIDAARFTDGIHLFTADGEELVYDNVVFATGHETKKFSWVFGDPLLNLYPVKGYSITIKGTPKDNFPTLSLLDDDKKIVSSTFVYKGGETAFRVAGTAELAGNNKDLNQKRLQPLKDWAYNNFSIKSKDISEWACLRPMMSNMLPIYKASRTPGVWYHTGHGHLGLTLAAGTARLLVNEMKEKI